MDAVALARTAAWRARLGKVVPGIGGTAGLRLLGLAGRLGWGVADQAVSSLSNFALGVVVARSLGAEGFGAFSLAYVTYAFVLSAMRGLATDPLLVRFSGPPSLRWRNAVTASTATAAAVGIVAGTACVLVGLALPGSLRGAFVVLGLALPGLMVQDAWRFAFFAVGTPVKALLNDLVWGALLLAALAGLLLTGHASVVTCVAAFGVTGALAAGFGAVQSHILPRLGAVRSWITVHSALGGRYLAENLAIGSARQLRMFALGALGGLVAVGETRAAEILMGPFLVILMGAAQVAVPEASHVLTWSPRHLRRFCLGLGGALAGAAAAWGLMVLALLPTGLGDLLLGPIWHSAGVLLPAVILNMVVGGFETAAMAGVRAMGAAPRSLKAQLTNAGLYVAGGGIGAYVAGAWGSAWGVAAATTIGTAVWWLQLHRAHREFMVTAAGSGPPTGEDDRLTA